MNNHENVCCFTRGGLSRNHSRCLCLVLFPNACPSSRQDKLEGNAFLLDVPSVNAREYPSPCTVGNLVSGFVKSGYSEPGSTTSVTYVNRNLPNQVGSSTLPTVSFNVNGAHTLAGEVILHHVIYRGNGAPVITGNVPASGTSYSRGSSQLFQLYSGGRNLNGGGLTLPASGADILTQLLTPNGVPDSRQSKVSSFVSDEYRRRRVARYTYVYK